MGIILFAVILAALILVHEFGHFIVAKRSHIRVDEFGIGFPPRLFGRKKGETIYSINAIPFGGFVKIFGEDPDEESISGPDSARSFVNKPRLTQAAVIAAGVAFNIFFAWFLFSTGFVLGTPTPVSSTDSYHPGEIRDQHVIVMDTISGSPAEQAGLQIGDRIVSLKSGPDELREVSTPDIQNFIAAHGDEEITLFYERGDEFRSAVLTPANGVMEGRPAIGIAMETVGIVRLSLPKAIFEGGKLTFNMIGAVAMGFATFIADAFRGAADFSQIRGPVGIVGLVNDAARFGLASLMSFTAFISINLAVINLIPFPALDGGRLIFILIESIKRSPINPKVANVANTVGFVLLIILMLVVTYSDIVKMF
jgi:regulator of sigma E protease